MQLATFQEDGGCFYCGEQMFFLDPGLQYGGNGDIEQSPDVASEDHVHPLNRGGSRHRSNVVVAHRGCNSIKGNTLPSEALLERLAALNEKRGFVIPEVPGQMLPNTFFPLSETTRAMFYVCDLLNAIEGKQGVLDRAKFGRRMEYVIGMRRSLRQITDEGNRLKLFQMFLNDLPPLFRDETLSSLTTNVCQAMLKRERRIIQDRFDAEKEERRLARVERRRLKKEAAQLLSETSSPPLDTEQAIPS